MKKILTLAILILTTISTSFSQTPLTGGDIAVIYHFGESGIPTTITLQDRIGLLLLKDIDAGTSFFITENGSYGVALGSDEGTLTFTAQTALSAGTVIDIVILNGSNGANNIIQSSNPTGAVFTSSGTTTSANADSYSIGTSGDQTIVYTGSSANPNYIYSSFFDGTSWDASCSGTCSGSSSAEPSSGPTFAFGAAATSEYDQNWYSGPTNFPDAASALAAVNNTANWTGSQNGTTGDVAANGLVASGIVIGGGPPSIDTDPMPATTCDGVATTFTVVATDATGYQWQESTNSGGSYTDIFNGGAFAGTDGATLTVTPTSAMDGNMYRCVVTGLAAPAATSNGAALTVETGEPRIVSANPINGEITIENCSANCSIDITGYQLCSKFSYTSIVAGMVVSGSLNIPANSSVTISWGAMSALGADLGIYVPGGSFANPAAMVDFVQWGSAGNGRESVASTAGLWAAGTFVAGSAPYTRANCNMNMVAAWNASAISTAAPGCNNFSSAGPVSGSGWFNIEDFAGNTIASINPNGANIGVVTVSIDDLAAPAQDNQNNYALPRHFNFESTMFSGVGSPFPSPVSIRLFYRADELAAYNTAAGTTLSTTDIVISHYSGPNEDCNLSNNADPSMATITDINPTAKSFNANDFYLEFDVAHFSEMSGGEGGLFLPVELMSFDGRALENANQVNWSTATEEAFSHFEVERSNDGYAFQTIAEVAGSGNSTEVVDYSYTDRTFSPASYYRLKMVDLDGTYEYSETILIMNEKEHNISIMPNPAKNSIKVKFDYVLEGNVQYSIIDMNGKEMMNGNVSNDLNSIDISQLPVGLYIINIMNSDQTTAIKLIKN